MITAKQRLLHAAASRACCYTAMLLRCGVWLNNNRCHIA
jgi:hypothetical protein